MLERNVFMVSPLSEFDEACRYGGIIDITVIIICDTGVILLAIGKKFKEDMRTPCHVK